MCGAVHATVTVRRGEISSRFCPGRLAPRERSRVRRRGDGCDNAVPEECARTLSLCFTL